MARFSPRRGRSAFACGYTQRIMVAIRHRFPAKVARQAEQPELPSHFEEPAKAELPEPEAALDPSEGRLGEMLATFVLRASASRPEPPRHASRRAGLRVQGSSALALTAKGYVAPDRPRLQRLQVRLGCVPCVRQGLLRPPPDVPRRCVHHRDQRHGVRSVLLHRRRHDDALLVIHRPRR